MRVLVYVCWIMLFGVLKWLLVKVGCSEVFYFEIVVKKVMFLLEKLWWVENCWRGLGFLERIWIRVFMVKMWLLGIELMVKLLLLFFIMDDCFYGLLKLRDDLWLILVDVGDRGVLGIVELVVDMFLLELNLFLVFYFLMMF